MENMKIHYVEISKLKRADYNPRTWNEKQMADLKASIRKYGFVTPLLANAAKGRENVILSGHFRVSAAEELGYDKVPVSYVKIEDIEAEKELNIRLNLNQGEWNWELLREFDLELLTDVGFSTEDLQHLWDDISEIEPDDFNVEEELQAIKEVTVKEGEIYKLGQHTLICGDSTDPKTIKTLVGKKKVHLISGDPPFNIGLSYDNGIGTKSKYGGSKVNDSKSDEEYKEFLKKTLENALAIAEPDCHMFYFCDQNYIWLLQTLYKELGIKHQRVCLWVKNSAMVTPQVAFNKCYEPVVYGIKGKPFLSNYHTSFSEMMNKAIGTGNRTHDDILDLIDLWLEKRLPSSQYLHPTEKPSTIYERIIRRCSKPGDYILELFGGSGSIMAACEQMNRRCLMVELDPLFCTLILKRYEKLTNQKAIKLN